MGAAVETQIKSPFGSDTTLQGSKDEKVTLLQTDEPFGEPEIDHSLVNTTVPRIPFKGYDFTGFDGQSILVAYNYDNDQQRAFVVPVKRPSSVYRGQKLVIPRGTRPSAQRTEKLKRSLLQRRLSGEDEDEIWQRIKFEWNARRPWWHFRGLLYRLEVVEEANVHVLRSLKEEYEVFTTVQDFASMKRKTVSKIDAITEDISYLDSMESCEAFYETSRDWMHIRQSDLCADLSSSVDYYECPFMEKEQLSYRLKALNELGEHRRCFVDPSRGNVLQPLREWTQESPIYDGQELQSLITDSHGRDIGSRPHIRCLRISTRRRKVPLDSALTLVITLTLSILWRLVQKNWELPALLLGPLIACIQAFLSISRAYESHSTTRTKLD